MSQTQNKQVKATPLQSFRVVTSKDRPDSAILELQVRGATQYYLMPKSSLTQLAAHLTEAAEKIGANKPENLM